MLVLGIFLLGILLALPNFFGRAPAVQMVSADGRAFTDSKIDEIVTALASVDVQPEAVYLVDGRAVVRFHNVEDQMLAAEKLRRQFDQSASIALTLAPKLPDWVRARGLSPMSL